MPADSDMADFGRRLARTPAPPRSRLAHNQSWQLLEARISRRRLLNRWTVWRLAGAAAAVAILAAGVFFTSQSALPGSLAYPVKRQIENLQVALATSDARKAEGCSGQMKRRANELARLSVRQLQTGTVRDLNNSILSEAQEYSGYIAKSTAGMDQLKSQRQRDIAYVTAALHYTLSHTQDPQQQKILRQTVAALSQSS